MPDFMVTATWMVKATDVETAVLAATDLLDSGGAAASGDWSVFEPAGDEWIEYEIEWNEDELSDPDDDTPSGIDYTVPNPWGVDEVVEDEDWAISLPEAVEEEDDPGRRGREIAERLNAQAKEVVAAE